MHLFDCVFEFCITNDRRTALIINGGAAMSRFLWGAMASATGVAPIAMLAVVLFPAAAGSAVSSQNSGDSMVLTGDDYDQWWQGGKRNWCDGDRTPMLFLMGTRCWCANSVLSQDHANKTVTFGTVGVLCKQPYVAAPAPKNPPPPQPPQFGVSIAGQWTGTWSNDLGESGSDVLVLSEDAQGDIQGLWSNQIPVSGARLDSTTLDFLGRDAKRSYQVTGTLDTTGQLTLSYVVIRLDADGSYLGSSRLQRSQ